MLVSASTTSIERLPRSSMLDAGFNEIFAVEPA
jgi:hypothetical protein